MVYGSYQAPPTSRLLRLDLIHHGFQGRGEFRVDDQRAVFGQKLGDMDGKGVGSNAKVLDVTSAVERLDSISPGGFRSDVLFFHLPEEAAGIVPWWRLSEFLQRADSCDWDVHSNLQVRQVLSVFRHVWPVELGPARAQNSRTP